MKPETPVWLKCESVGRPANTLTMQCSTREAVRTIAEWLMGTYMGQKIRITLARTEEELSTRHSSNVQSMMDELDSIIGGTPEACPICKTIGQCTIDHDQMGIG